MPPLSEKLLTVDAEERMPESEFGQYRRSSLTSSSTSIGLGLPAVAPAPPEQSPSSHPRQFYRISYFRALSRQMAPEDRVLLAPPPHVLIPASIADLSFVPAGSRAGSLGIIFTIWNTMMGSTLLVMPYVFQESGWLLGAAICAFCAMVSQYTCSLILKYAAVLMSSPSAEIADLAEMHFGLVGRYTVFGVGNLVVIGAAAAMHGYCAAVMQELVEFPHEQGGFDWGTIPNPKYYALAVLVPCLPLANLPSIRLLARLNTVGVFCFMVLLSFAYSSLNYNHRALNYNQVLLSFAYSSAAYAKVDVNALQQPYLAKPASAGIVFGIFSLSFFIHNAVITIFRSSAEPSKNQRNMTVAYTLTWWCYASMGVLTNLCPPMHNLAALASDNAKNSFLSIPQPAEMANFLIIARLAVLVQSITVYPVMLFIVRSQVFSVVYRNPYPGPLPVLLLSSAMACMTTALTLAGVHISDVLRFAGAAGAMICSFGLPALIHGKVSREQRQLTFFRTLVVAALCAFGAFSLGIQFIPPPQSNTTAPALPPPASPP